jgi:hypothetical protein
MNLHGHGQKFSSNYSFSFWHPLTTSVLSLSAFPVHHRHRHRATDPTLPAESDSALQSMRPDRSVGSDPNRTAGADYFPIPFPCGKSGI